MQKKLPLLVAALLASLILLSGCIDSNGDDNGNGTSDGNAGNGGADDNGAANGGNGGTINPPAYERFYSDSSPFNQKIQENPEIDPNSDAMVAALQKASVDNSGEENLITVSVGIWSPALFYADSSTQKYDIELTADWAPKKKLLNVPIPSNVKVPKDDDGSVAIIDISTGYEYDFWQLRKEAGKWKASWANRVPADGDGIFPKALSARGSGFALLAGMIRAEELEKGKIEHALFLTFDFTKAGGPVPPATESDGGSIIEGAIPEGARIQLDPELDLDSLGLTPAKKTIAKAMQEYGIFLGDSGGGFEIEALNPASYGADKEPYKGLLEIDEEGFAYIAGIPFSSFRVLKLAEQYDLEPEIAEPEIFSD